MRPYSTAKPPSPLSVKPIMASFSAFGLLMYLLYILLMAPWRRRPVYGTDYRLRQPAANENSNALDNTNIDNGLSSNKQQASLANGALPNSNIPMTLWQTYATHGIPQKAKDCMNTWKQLNPGLITKLQDDNEAEEFLRNNFRPEVLRAYKNFPLNVMRADFWRYAILYIYGGIYADIDVECRRPIKDWMIVPDNMKANCQDCSWEDCEIIVSQEGDKGEYVSQWVRSFICLFLFKNSCSFVFITFFNSRRELN